MSKLVAFLSLSLFLTAFAATQAQDPVAVDPVVHQVALENDHVRVFRGIVAPGHQSPMHAHPAMVVVSLGTARLRFTMPDGAQPILDVTPGQILWLDATVHSWELLAGEMNVVAIELKGVQAAAGQ